MLLNFHRLLTRFKPGKSLTIGLDIGQAEVRMVELSGSGNAIRLDRYARESLPYGGLDGAGSTDHGSQDGIDDLQQVTQAVARLLDKSGTQAKRVVIGLPPSCVVADIMTVKAGIPEDQLETLARARFAGKLPYPLDEASIDVCIVGPSSSSGTIDVVIAAARNDDVEDRIAIAEASGLQIVAADIDSYAAHAALLHAGWGDEQVVLLRMETHATHLSFMNSSHVLGERHYSFGRIHLLHAFMRHYGVSQTEAEQRLQDGNLPDGYTDDVLMPYVEQAASKAQEALQSMPETEVEKRIGRLVLAGNAAAIPGLAQALTDKTGIPVTLASPFARMSIADNIDAAGMAHDAPSLLVACGLALRRCDP